MKATSDTLGTRWKALLSGPNLPTTAVQKALPAAFLKGLGSSQEEKAKGPGVKVI